MIANNKRLSASPSGAVVEMAEMDKCVKCLALELPEAVHDDVARIWGNLKSRLAVPSPVSVDRQAVDKVNGPMDKDTAIKTLMFLLRQVFYYRFPHGDRVDDFIQENDSALWKDVYSWLEGENKPVPAIVPSPVSVAVFVDRQAVEKGRSEGMKYRCSQFKTCPHSTGCSHAKEHKKDAICQGSTCALTSVASICLPSKPLPIPKPRKVLRPETCDSCPMFGVCGCYAPHQSATEQSECKKAWRRLSRYLAGADKH